jgi:hypothetical protein
MVLRFVAFYLCSSVLFAIGLAAAFSSCSPGMLA